MVRIEVGHRISKSYMVHAKRQPLAQEAQYVGSEVCCEYLIRINEFIIRMK